MVKVNERQISRVPRIFFINRAKDMPDCKFSLSPYEECVESRGECCAPSADELQIGEVYVFNTDDPACPSGSSLWGVFDKCEGGRIYLESSSEDLQHFTHACKLPDRYRYWRLTTRSELRDYISALVFSERALIL